MSLRRARIVKGAFVDSAQAVTPRAVGAATARRVPREAMEARDEAARILAGARASAAAAAEEAAREAREEEAAKAATAYLALRALEEQRAERDLERTIAIATLLAERVVGEAIAENPVRIAALAAEALRETRGARKITVEASPDDVPVLTEALSALGEGVAAAVPNGELGRGSLIVHTELGRVDARLPFVLSRLAGAVREALRSGGPASSIQPAGDETGEA
jgi:flagellar biosynthesis/type III secretory pathway protein FliH